MPDLAKNIINLLIGVALFIAGMNLMSAGLKKATGKSLKKLFNKIGNSKIAGLGIGTGVTALIQSSGATSVMTIGFINAGVMTITQGLLIILGAYIGTTVTGVLVSLSSIQGLSSCMALTALVGIILNFFKKEKVKSIGTILTGLGILFVGLEMMKSAFSEGELLNAFQTLFTNISSPILLFVVGAIFTCLTQSSSATSGIVIVMVGQGALTLASGFYLVLGATVGTVLVTIIASVGGSVDSKRTAILCLLIRTITGLLALAIVWPIESCCDNALSRGLSTLFGNNVQFTLAMFLVFYNLIFVGVLLPFINPLVKLSTILIKDKEAENKKKALRFIDERLLITPTVALGQAKNEISHMLNLSKLNLEIGYDMLKNLDFDREEELKDREGQIDYINNAITNYLIKLAQNASLKDETKVGSYFHIINDIERIGDHAYNFYESALKLKEDELKFSTTAKNELDGLFGVVVDMFGVADDIFMRHNKTRLPELHSLEDKTDKLKAELSNAHFERITKNECITELSPFYTTIVSELERVADHLVNIGYSLINPTGDDENISI